MTPDDRVVLGKVLRATESVTNIKAKDILGKKRTRAVTLPRGLVAYTLSELGWSNERIAEALNRKTSGSSAAHWIATTSLVMTKDDGVRQMQLAIINRVQDSTSDTSSLMSLLRNLRSDLPPLLRDTLSDADLSNWAVRIALFMEAA